jgi:hypothetical protein
VVANELHDKPQLVLTENRLDRADDSRPAGDLEPVTRLKLRCLT